MNLVCNAVDHTALQRRLTADSQNFRNFTKIVGFVRLFVPMPQRHTISLLQDSSISGHLSMDLGVSIRKHGVHNDTHAAALDCIHKHSRGCGVVGLETTYVIPWGQTRRLGPTSNQRPSRRPLTFSSGRGRRWQPCRCCRLAAVHSPLSVILRSSHLRLILRSQIGIADSP